MTLWCDRIFTAGIIFLIVATPFAFGTVQAWAYTAMEVVIFGLVVVWMAKRAILARQHGSGSSLHAPCSMLPFALPLALFVALCLFQLLPLPPSLLQAISPQTFEVYKQSLPGWPEQVPYADLESMEQGAGSAEQDAENAIDAINANNAESEEQSAKGEAQRATPNATNAVNATNATNATNSADNPQSEIPRSSSGSSRLPAPSSLLPETWLPLSISTGLTKIDLLKFVAFAALFFLVWRYPFEKPFANFEPRTSNLGFFILSPEQRFLRSVVFAVLGTGLLVAAFGFVERFAWNGDILLFVAGYESGAPAANTVARASGPFINPDNFANYLSLIFPLALGCALFRTFMVPRSQQYGLKIFCGFTVFLLFTGILLSLSRGAWISTLLGISIFAWLSPWGAERQRTRQGTGSREQDSGQRSLRLGSGQAPVRDQRSEVRDQTSEMRGHRRRSRKRRSGGISDFGFRISDFFLRVLRLASEVRDQRSAPGSMPQAPHSKLGRVARLSAITVCILLMVSLFLAGQGGREQVDLRLSETIEQSDLGMGARVSVILKDIPKMIMDFPLLGMGLGAWPELFLRYRSGPWSTVFFREAHNDYLELLAETGLIGFGLLAVFFFVAGNRLVRGLRKASSKYLPLIAGILSALGGMAVHEWLDFNLQIPAIAFLFTVLLAVGLRLAGSREHGAGSGAQEIESMAPWEIGDQRSAISMEQGAWSREVSRPRSGQRSASGLTPHASRLTPYVGAAAAVGMIVLAVTQDQSSYPHNFREMTSLAEARELLLKHPTHSPYHMSVLRLAGETAPLEWQLTQAKAALWNEPVNPNYRDFYAATLMAMERTEEGLKEVTRSVAESPSLSTHVYLGPENLPGLSEEEQAAVEEGLKQALSRSYPEALIGLADFYAKLERFADQGALYEQAAGKETDNARKAELLINGGMAYVKAAGSSEQGAGSKSEVRGQRSEVSETAGSKGVSARGKAQGAANAMNATATNANNAPNAINATNANNATNSELHAPGSMLYAAAERAFRAAAAINPADPKPYQQLVAVVFAAENDFAEPKRLIANAIEKGAPALPLYLSLAEAAHKGGNPEESKTALDLAKAEVDKLIKNGDSPYTLYMALADGTRRAGDRDEESAALLKALDRQPRSPQTLMRLANVYSEKGNYDRATMYLNRVASITPNSADLFYRIGQTEEARYRFAAAGRAYARAIELAPQNDGYRQRYEAFRERVDRNRVTGDGGQGLADGGRGTEGQGLTSRTDGRQVTGGQTGLTSRADGRRGTEGQR